MFVIALTVTLIALILSVLVIAIVWVRKNPSFTTTAVTLGHRSNENERDVYVVGAGGAGQTSIMKHLQRQSIRTNHVDDKDGLKHCPFRSDLCGGTPKLYVYGHPALVVQSHYRRNWEKIQANKLNPGVNTSQMPASAEDYLKLNDDPYFSMEKHMGQWLEKCPSLLAVTIDDVVQHPERVAEHLGINVDKVKGLSLKERHAHSDLEASPYFEKAWGRMRAMARTTWAIRSKGGSRMHFVTYGNDRFKESRERITNEAKKTNVFASVSMYTEKDLPRLYAGTSKQFQVIANERRGGGDWRWKPAVVRDALANVPEGDFVVWSDAGSTVLSGQEWDRIPQSNADCIVFMNNHQTHHTAKKALLEMYPIDDEEITPRGTRGGLIVVRNTTAGRAFADEWWEVAKSHPTMFDDSVSSEEHPEFQFCRHDQAVLGRIAKVHKCLHWDMNQDLTSVWKATRIKK